MKKHTLAEIMALGPCWPRERVEALLNGEPATALDVLLCSDVPDSDAVWLASRMATPAQRQQAAWVLADEAQANAVAVVNCADYAAYAASAAADCAAYAAYAVYAAAYTAYAATDDETRARAAFWHLAREVFAVCCQEVTT